MKRYWDSSALLESFFDSRIEKEAQEPDQWTRSHTCSEMFSMLTGGRLGVQFYPSDAAAIIRELTASMNWIDLQPKEVLEALDQAEKRGVRGGNVHDWLHACAARKSGAKQLLTLNLSDFQNLADGFKVELP